MPTAMMVLAEKLKLGVRLELRALTRNGSHFQATIFNAGNVACVTARVDVYRFGRDEPVATATFSVGVLEERTVTVPSDGDSSGPGSGPHYGIAFDPLRDPFPLSRLGELARWQENQLLKPLQATAATRSLGDWKQYSFLDDDHEFTNEELVPANRITWTFKDYSGHADHRDDNGEQITQAFHPGKPPKLDGAEGIYTELRQKIAVSQEGAFAQQQAEKGNLSVELSARVWNWRQSPRDRGAIALMTRFSDSLTASSPIRLALHAVLTAKSATIPPATPFDEVAVRLLSQRRTGPKSDSYFLDVHCHLKHRQVKVCL